MTSIGKIFLTSAHKRLSYYKDLGDKALAVLEEKDLYYQPNTASNTIAVIIQHLSGNMLSRWTDFLTSDGEKPWRQRDAEFENSMADKKALIAQWQQGWACCLDSIASLQEADLLKTIYIRHEPLTVMDAINRQLAHYPYHVGQLIYIARMIRNDQWQSLSIPKNQSQQFNEAMQKPH
ncbi:MAG: hypothetical protein RL172_474 [Bacteroidota bacterium]|jgi:hypothetical protein